MRYSVTRSIIAIAVIALAAAFIFGPSPAFHFLPSSVAAEEARLAALLEVAPGQTIAEIGAGDGDLSVAMAQRLLPGGKLYATELSPERRKEIQERVDREGVTNIEVVAAEATSTGLPEACCDAIFMRKVYHHIGDSSRFNVSLRRTIRPGGRLAVMDFAPGTFSDLVEPPEGAARERTGHGVSARAVAQELERAGFRVEQTVNDWGGDLYLVLLRAPE